ncbi:hypothetical protein ACE1B6_23735 [Aerosakkonemataceae cyanobacterium BLCC-F154]|uniref:Uncharacterized protein n=2 Tax=Floridanema TaxID=3396149 RepID=A0ABV4YHH1_9CYAN
MNWLAIAQKLLLGISILTIGFILANIAAHQISKLKTKNAKIWAHITRFTLLFLVTLIATQQIKLDSFILTPTAKNNQAIAQQQNSNLSWKNVLLGGGGYVTGIYLHPQQKDLVYIRTDIGGFYRWNPQNQTWIPITDRFPKSQSDYYGGESLALDPNNPNTVYIAAGKYLWSKPGSIFKSTNRGQTWQKLDIDLPMGGNEDKRWMGERLAVNPFNSQVILFGSRRDGLWRSNNSGETWNQVTSLPNNSRKGIGITGILFDKRVSNLVYAVSYGDGIYKSTDAGVTWRKIPESPQFPRRMAISSNGTLYVTSSKGPGVTKYAKNAWSNITPEKSQATFNAITVNPNNPNHILVSTGETDSTRLYGSWDGGKTWQRIKRTMNSTVPWWRRLMLKQPWISAIEFDPKVFGRAWLTDWYGIWRTENYQTNPVVWTNYQKGHEEIVTFALVSPPKGAPLLSAVADVDGFYHDNGLNAFPTREFGGQGPNFQDTYSIAYNEKNPLRVVRVGGNRWNNTFGGATSTDGGQSWQKFPTFPEKKMPLRVAVSATNPEVFLVTISDEKPLLTKDGGKTWSEISTLPKGAKGPWNWAQPLAADPIDGKTFYYYAGGKLYRSTDGGANFEIVNESLLRDRWHSLKTAPGIKGELWLSLDKDGLFRSTNAGKTFSKIPTVERAFLFALGKPPRGSKVPALYLYGKIAGKNEGIFRSLDRGRTWTSISDRSQPIGNNPNVMEASKQQFGLVFIGTNGRGIYYRNTQ